MSAAENDGARWRLRRTVLILAIFVIATIPVLTTTVLPMVDFYNHVARYFVLAHIDHDAFLSANYQAHWAILPNIGLDILGTGLMRIMDPLAAAHVIVVAVFATQYFGILYFNRQLTGRVSLLTALLAAPLLYSFIFNWGFANFLLGLGFVFWAIGFRLALRARPLAAFAVGCISAVVIFLTHGVAFALYGLLAGALELGLFVESRPRRLAILARNLGLLALQALLPAFLFLTSSTSKAGDGVTNADESVRRLADSGRLIDRLHELIAYRLTTILQVAESPVAWFDVASFIAAATILLILALRGRLRVAAAAWFAIALGLLLVAFVPPTLFGVGYVADRMPLFLAFVVIGALAFQPGKDVVARIGVVGLVALVCIRLAVIDGTWQRNQGDLLDFHRAAAAIPAGKVVGFVDAANVSRLGVNPRCQMYGPLLVALQGQASSLFASGLQQPLLLNGPLAAAQESLPKSVRSIAAPEDRLDTLLEQSRFDYVVVCDMERLRRGVQAPSRTLSHSGRFTVLQSSR